MFAHDHTRGTVPRLAGPRRRPRPSRVASRRRPLIEALEDRSLLSTWLVDGLGDAGLGSGTSGDLRWAVAQANADTDPAGALVRFDPTLFATPQTITLGSSLELSNTAVPVTVDGTGVGPVTVTVNQSVRAFQVDQNVTASLEGLNLTGRGTREKGGGVLTHGTLVVTACALTGNAGEFSDSWGDVVGGGIENYGTLRVESCTISSSFPDSIPNAYPDVSY
jgi:hypothetical protein